MEEEEEEDLAEVKRPVQGRSQLMPSDWVYIAGEERKSRMCRSQ